MGVCGLDASGSEQGPVAGCCKHGKEPSASTTVGKFLDCPSDCQLLKNSTVFS
jgi:hypothetical protein